MKAIIFDLDNTLYDQNTFTYSAFKKISKYLKKKYDVNWRESYRFMRKVWKKRGGMYGHLFDDVAKKFKLRKSAVKEMIDILHKHRTKLKLYNSTRSLLKKLGRKYKLGIITSGYKKMQQNKIRVLKLERLVDVVIYSAENGKKFEKPHPLSYKIALKKLGVKAKDAMYFGDNPYVDFAGAKKIGIQTVRLRRGWFKDKKVSKASDADFYIKDLKKLPGLIKRIEAQNGKK